jgi:hypothetical protein
VKRQTIAALALFASVLAAPALAQPQGDASPGAAASTSRFSVSGTPIGAIWADPKGKQVLLKHLPEIGMYIDMIKDMTLVQVAPQSGGAIDDAKLKAVQTDLDSIK